MLKTVNFYPRLMVLWTISCPNSSQNEKRKKPHLEEAAARQGRQDGREGVLFFIQFK